MKFPIFGASNDDMGTSAAFAYLSSTHAIDWNATEARRQIPLSEAVTVSDFKVILDTAPGVGNSRTFTLRKNGGDTAATVTISGAATSAAFAGSVSFAAGDLISIGATSTGTPTAPGNTYWYTYLNTTGQKALIMGGSANVAPNGADNYVDVFGGTAWTTTSGDQDVPVPTGGNLTKLAVATSGAPTAGKSYAFSMRLNGSSDVLTATVSGTGTSASATGSQALVAGDLIQFKSSPSGTPTQAAVGWCFTFEPTINGESIAGFGAASALSTTTTQYSQPLGVGNNGWSTAEANHLLKLPACSYKNLYVRLSAAPVGVATRTITMRDNSAASALTVTITGAATTGNDTTHTVTHTADQSIGVQSALATAPAAANLHMGYVIVTTQPAAAVEGTGTATGSATASGTFAAVGAITGTSTGTGTASGTFAGVGTATGTVSGAATAAGVLAALGELVGSAAGVAAAAGSLGATSPGTGAASGVAVAAGGAGVVVGTTGTVTIGSTTTTVRRPVYIFDD